MVIITIFFVLLALDLNYGGYKRYGLRQDDFIDGLAVFEVNDKQGVINEDSDIVVPAIYDAVVDYTSKLFYIYQNGYFGFMDKSGNVLIEPKFSSIDEFGEDRILLSHANKYLIIDTSGNIIKELSCSSINSLKEDLAVISKDSKCGYIDKNGDIVIDYKFDDAFDFEDVNAHVNINSVRYIINKKGEIIEKVSTTPEPREKDEYEKQLDEYFREKEEESQGDWRDTNDKALRYWYGLD